MRRTPDRIPQSNKSGGKTDRVGVVINTILFDNWNTLVQAPALMKRGASLEIFQRSLLGQGLNYDCDKFVEAYRRIARSQVAEAEANGWTEIDYVKRLVLTLEELGVGEPQRSTYAKMAWDEYLAEWPRQTSFYPDTPALLGQLRGMYKLGVVTNFMDGPTARKVFDDLGYKKIFGSLIVSAEVGYMKPAPILFERALGELGSRPENALMVGDTYEADIVGAHALGIRCVLIDLYGASEEQLKCSDAVIKRIGDLPEALKGLQ
ncbi:MAG: HAD family hydrolase [Candidatus Bathyarchaeia archaeon]|jgi:HAD superfamily hydrolase (TIGR01549 family)